MPTIFDRDFGDYPDPNFLADVEMLVTGHVAEGTTLEYKVDLSDAGGWLQDIVAFANTYGGILIIGVAAPKGIPTGMPGFERVSEVALDITNQINSCIHPRPEIGLKTVKINGETSRWIAAVHVSEGLRPPYLYSRAGKNRIYVRSTAGKIEPDYLQLMRLMDKANFIASRGQRVNSAVDLLRNSVFVRRSPSENSGAFYRFVAAGDLEETSQITHSKEQNFQKALLTIYRMDHEQIQQLTNTTGRYPCNWARGPANSSISYFFNREAGQESFQRHWYLSTVGIGFASIASHEIDGSQYCSLVDVVYDLIFFLDLVSTHYADRHYFGDVQVWADLVLSSAPNRLGIEGVLYPDYIRLPEPRELLAIDSVVQGQANGGCRLTLQRPRIDRTMDAIHELLNTLARGFGGVLRNDIAFLRPVVEDILSRQASRIESNGYR